jgi:hypothetical protein
MANKLKKNQALVEQAVFELFGVTDIKWRMGGHPVGTFFIKGCKFTYSVDSTNKGEYTLKKTKHMITHALVLKALSHGFIKDPSGFEKKFINQ